MMIEQAPVDPRHLPYCCVRFSPSAVSWILTTESRLFNCGFLDAGAELIASGLAANKTLERLE